MATLDPPDQEETRAVLDQLEMKDQVARKAALVSLVKQDLLATLDQ